MVTSFMHDTDINSFQVKFPIKSHGEPIQLPTIISYPLFNTLVANATNIIYITDTTILCN